MSISMHAGVIVLAIQATLHAGQSREAPAENVAFSEVAHDEPAPPRRADREAAPAAPLETVLTLSAPLNIPDELPDIDFSRKPTNGQDWLQRGVPGVRGAAGTGIAPGASQVYLESEVEQPAMALAGSPVPRYPEILRTAGVEGEVVASFVVDTTGRADSASLRIMSTTNDLFGAAVRAALPGMRFIPAEVGGRKVRQQVQQPFVFAIVR